ncbi:MAG: DUF4287 domain-containing protein [Candidatus Planktophila sp.]|nr:DUF4287 domain-containing protein [Candidatus Planktophila sp.]
MPPKDPTREAHFPAIEKRYGEKMAYWFRVMATLEGKKYLEQIAHLKESYGFSQTHANALVMYSRGSTSSRRFETPKDYFKTLSPEQRKTIKAIFAAITGKYPKLELVIAWNQPMLRLDKKYIFGVSTTKNYILLAPFSADVLDAFRPKLSEYTVNKKTIAVPNDWSVDTKLLLGMAKMRMAES